MSCVLNLLIVCVLSLSTDLAISTDCPRPSFTPNLSTNREKADLKVLVPNITTLRQFIDCSDPTRVRGFCIDVFEKALSILPYSPSNMSINYTCLDFPTTPNASAPTYNSMVDLVADGSYDAVVGDVTIGAYRLSKVDFTQYYMESGVVLLTKVDHREFSPWLFFAWPFSFRMWCTIVASFVLVGFLVCFLEHNHHPEFTTGPIMHRIHKIFLFMIEELVLLQKETLKSTISQMVMVAWVFFLILLGTSYTAGLSSFLTAKSLSPTTQNIISLRESGKKLGYRRGSLVKDYLMTRYHIPNTQLKPIREVSDFVHNITMGPEKGGVLAIVDELPYVNILLSNLSSSTCDFSMSEPQLTSEGFGFGFKKESNLSAEFSIAILNLSESGCLQKMRDSYNMSKSSTCSTSNSFSTQVSWKSSLALFIPFGGALFLCIVVDFVRRRLLRTQHTLPNEGPNVIDDDSTSYLFRELIHRHHHREVDLYHDQYRH